MISNFLLVALGGALGSVLRYGAGLIPLPASATSFPWVTLAINISGSLLIGVLSQALSNAQEMRLFLIVGLLGGYTTFSAFSLDAIALFERGSLGLSFLYVAASTLLSIVAAFLGVALMRGAAA